MGQEESAATCKKRQQSANENSRNRQHIGRKLEYSISRSGIHAMIGKNMARIGQRWARNRRKSAKIGKQSAKVGRRARKLGRKMAKNWPAANGSSDHRV